MTNLTQLLKDLGTEAPLQEEYLKDPREVMSRYGLNDEETQAMLDKDVEKLKQLSGLDKLKSNDIVHEHDP